MSNLTDNDVIIKAVELADNWLWNWGRAFFHEEVQWGQGGTFPDEAEQWHLDILAAQLVRQVDAIGLLECDITAVSAWIYCPSNEEATHPAVVGQDRTMNTIRAIVESGVLEQVAGLDGGNRDEEVE